VPARRSPAPISEPATQAEPYRLALLDWLACAAAGRREPAAVAARDAGSGLLERVTAAGCAGHVLDYDDTYTPGLVHASAPVAPAALLLAAELGRDAGAALDAFAAGWEATAALARAGHPALYERGWHPTAVCGTVGAAIASARLLGLTADRTRDAAALALLRAGGLRAAFGSPGKALQVGGAAAAGLQAARLAASGARAPLDAVAHGAAGFEQAFGARWAEPDGQPAVGENWIKAYPCCLGAHSPIEAALALRESGRTGQPIVVVVHPVARQAAALDDVGDGLQAKFSIPYLVAFALLHGAPGHHDFDTVDAQARALARDSITIALDPALAEMEARIESAGETIARVETALGSPARPMDAVQLRRKVRDLAGQALDGLLDDPALPARDVLDAAGLA
jgi:2-methylcitrate dehydratase PrpD